MLYVIGQLWIFLLLTAAFAAFAGWMWAAHRAEPARQGLRRRRDRLVHDLAQLAAGEGWDAAPDAARAAERDDSLTRIRESRIAELERALESTRLRAGEAAAEAAELRRRLEQNGADTMELAQLRGLVAAHEAERAREIETDAQTVSADDAALQAWRLRYFEQRVRYLEEGAAPAAAADAPAPSEDGPLAWRARDAEARAAYLEQELRAHTASAAAPVAANAEVDALLGWRLRYLERRTAHLQQARAAEPVAEAVAAEAAPDPDRWKWRARYLESRVRHLEQRAGPAAPVAAPLGAPAPAEPVAPAATPLRPTRRGVKPPVLASARNGAPDDLTLIEGISLQQQSTFYSLGVFHFDQIAAWTPDQVAWVDRYLRLGARIDEEDWVEQADELAREGFAAARRAPADATV